MRPHEIDALLAVSGTDLNRKQAVAVHAFLFAIETAMRAGEITGLLPDSIDLKRRVAYLPMMKNGKARQVPLSSRAVELIERLPKTNGPLFGITSMQLSALFRKVKKQADIDGLTFHDSHHEAITCLAKKLHVMDLARMVGHSNINMLMVYYNETAESLAKKLD